MSRFRVVWICLLLLVGLLSRSAAAQTVFDVSPQTTLSGSTTFADASTFTSTGLTLASASTLTLPDLSTWANGGLLFAPTSILTLPGNSIWSSTNLFYSASLNIRGPDASTWSTTGFAVGAGKQFYLADGTGVAPALTFATELTTGLYRAGMADLRVVLSGLQALRFSLNSTTPQVSIPVGASTATAPVNGTVCKSSTSAATTGTTLQTLASCTLPANALSLNGMGLKVKAWGITAANANNKTLALAFGASTCATLTGAVNNGSIVVETTILRVSATLQECGGSGLSSTGGGMTTRAAPAETLANAIILAAQATTPTASGDFTFKGLTVEVLN